MNILTISEEALRSILDDKLLLFDKRLEYLSEQNDQLRKTINSLIRKANPEEKLTVKEAARELKVKESTVREWCRNDRIEYQLSGSQYRITRRAIQKYLGGGNRLS